MPSRQLRRDLPRAHARRFLITTTPHLSTPTLYLSSFLRPDIASTHFCQHSLTAFVLQSHAMSYSSDTIDPSASSSLTTVILKVFNSLTWPTIFIVTTGILSVIIAAMNFVVNVKGKEWVVDKFTSIHLYLTTCCTRSSASDAESEVAYSSSDTSTCVGRLCEIWPKVNLTFEIEIRS